MQPGSQTQLAAHCNSRHMAVHDPRGSPKLERALLAYHPGPIGTYLYASLLHPGITDKTLKMQVCGIGVGY